MRGSQPPNLSNDQKQNICMFLSAGCDRETAAKLANCSHWDIHGAMLGDATFATEVRHAEGASELAHVRNVQNAAQDVKNWRASVWWLERRSPERYGKRDAGTVTTRHLRAFVAQLVSIVVEELQDVGARQRLVDRFDQLLHSLDQLMFEEPTPMSNPCSGSEQSLLNDAQQENADKIDVDASDLDEELE
jgi:hypothetical protein